MLRIGLLAAALPLIAAAAEPASPGLLDGKVTGKPQQCLSVTAMRSTRIASDSVVLFQVGSRWYRSNLGTPCIGMRPDSAIQNTVHGGSICAGDPFTVFRPGLGPGLGMVMGQCIYAPFEPYELPKAAGR